MTPGMVMEVGRQALEVTIMISAPMLLVGLVVGVIVSVFQAATSLNEATITFIPKLLAMFVTMLVAGPWMLQTLVDYMQRLFNSIPSMIG